MKKILAILGVFCLITPVLFVFFLIFYSNENPDFLGFTNGVWSHKIKVFIYMTAMTLVGLWLIKDNLRYLLKKDKAANNSKNNTE